MKVFAEQSGGVMCRKSNYFETSQVNKRKLLVISQRALSSIKFVHGWLQNCKRDKAKMWVHYKPSLFQHIGTHSSLKGKVQKLKVGASIYFAERVLHS
jgi:hypothetical protein